MSCLGMQLTLRGSWGTLHALRGDFRKFVPCGPFNHFYLIADRLDAGL